MPGAAIDTHFEDKDVNHCEMFEEIVDGFPETKRLDLGVDVETYRRESLRTPGPAIRAGL